ncbi:MAG: threonine synthase [Alphaproteobacteria bacterium]|nr:threonine synthase [Alphaproteobacteria bacterium]
MAQDVRYINPRTSATWPVDTALWRAPDDSGYINLTPGEGLSRDAIDGAAHSLWRYGAAIRLPAQEYQSLGEGWTPMVPSHWRDTPVLMKSEHLMPSGSFKDRGVAVMLNYLRQVGVREIMEDSSGNGGASVATYGAALDFDCRILVPASAPAPKRYQMAAMGAEVVAVPGSRDDVAQAALDQADSRFYAGHNYQPYFLEGTKTLAFEIWEQLGFEAPDCVIIPLGKGSNVMGCHLGFAELLGRGEIDRMPRLYGVQAANAAPYYAAYAADSEEPVPIEAMPTIADGIASAKPVRLREVLAAMRPTGGACLAVTEEEIIDALRDFSAKGFFVEPTTAAAGAGLGKLLADGRVRRDERIVMILTGSGLKAVETIGRVLGLDVA